MKNKNIIEHYKKYGVKEGDKLLLETAKNNFLAGQKAEQERSIKLCDRCKPYQEGQNSQKDNFRYPKDDFWYEKGKQDQKEKDLEIIYEWWAKRTNPDGEGASFEELTQKIKGDEE